MNIKGLVALLQADAWFQVRVKGSLRQYLHREKPGTVTVAGKPGIDVPPGTLSSALKQAGLKKAEQFKCAISSLSRRALPHLGRTSQIFPVV